VTDSNNGSAIPSVLGQFRALDLTNEKGHLCGKILGDLGVDVVKIEPPGGDPARRLGPFYGGEPHPEKSLPWWAFNTSKRSITLDLAGQAGRQTFLELVRGSDFVIESFMPGHMASIGLGYEKLREINPGMIMVSVSGFGQDGPYSTFRAPDIVCMAMGGNMNLTGDPDRPPLRPSVPQAYAHAGSDAAAAALLALWHRERTGWGQHVDVSAQECIAWQCFHNYVTRDFQGINLSRSGAYYQVPDVGRIPHIFPCKDGLVFLVVAIGEMGRVTRTLVEWMAEEGKATDDLLNMDWVTNGVGVMFPGETMEQIMARIRKFEPFLLSKTKNELYEQATRRGFLLAPVNSVRDICEDPHLEIREFWRVLKHRELDSEIKYPGAPCIAPETPYELRRRPPLIGEHNADVPGLLARPKVSLSRQHTGDSTVKEAFGGLKVVDFSRWVVGPRTARYFGDHGATVVKIESPTPGGGRVNAPYKDGIIAVNRSTWFSLYNVNRYGMTLDLSKPDSTGIVRRLIRWADVFIEAFRPGVTERMGLDYNSVKDINPRLIYASTSMMGQTGPRRHYGGFGYQAAAIAGFDDLTGWPDRPPSGVFFAYTDNIAPPFLVASIITALLRRERSGEGQYIDQSQNECAIQYLVPALIEHMSGGADQTRNGNRDANYAPHGAYRCLGNDRWCVIAVTSDEEWQNFGRAVGGLSWIQSPRWATQQARKESEDELDRLVETWTMQYTPETVMVVLQAAGVPAGLVETAEDMHRDPQLKYRNHFLMYDHPVIGPHAVDALPFRFTDTPARQYLPDPCLGEHNAFVCTEILGMPDEEFARLLGNGTFGAT